MFCLFAIAEMHKGLAVSRCSMFLFIYCRFVDDASVHRMNAITIELFGMLHMWVCVCVYAMEPRMHVILRVTTWNSEIGRLSSF